MSYVSSYCLFRTKDRPRIVQPSLRDFGYLLPKPTLERVGYSRISSPGDVSRKTSSATTAHGPKMSKLQAPLRSESSSPTTEMVPLKTAVNQPGVLVCSPRDISFEPSLQRFSFGTSRCRDSLGVPALTENLSATARSRNQPRAFRSSLCRCHQSRVSG